jgi:hypothetical protein
MLGVKKSLGYFVETTKAFYGSLCRCCLRELDRLALYGISD